MIKNAQEYSWLAKRLQIAVILLTVGLLIGKAIKANAHVDMHFDRLAWDIDRSFDKGTQCDADIVDLLYPPAASEEIPQPTDQP